MGTRKALQRLGTKFMIQHVVDKVADLVDEVRLVVDDPVAYASLGVPTITDIEPDVGPLMGLYTGISAAKTPWVLAVGCDTPFLAPRLLEAILAAPREADIVAAEANGRLQPLPALYSAECERRTRAVLDAGQRALQDLLASVELYIIPEAEVLRFDPKLESFFDLDTQTDLRRAEELLGFDP